MTSALQVVPNQKRAVTLVLISAVLLALARHVVAVDSPPNPTKPPPVVTFRAFIERTMLDAVSRRTTVMLGEAAVLRGDVAMTIADVAEPDLLYAVNSRVAHVFQADLRRRSLKSFPFNISWLDAAAPLELIAGRALAQSKWEVVKQWQEEHTQIIVYRPVAPRFPTVRECVAKQQVNSTWLQSCVVHYLDGSTDTWRLIIPSRSRPVTEWDFMVLPLPSNWSKDK